MSQNVNVIKKWKTPFGSPNVYAEYLFQLENKKFVWAHQTFFNVHLLDVAEWPVDTGGTGSTMTELEKFARDKNKVYSLVFLNEVSTGLKPDWIVENINSPGIESKTTDEKLCTCSLGDIMAYGCQCGGK